jgi:hypothetical protein
MRTRAVVRAVRFLKSLRRLTLPDALSALVYESVRVSEPGPPVACASDLRPRSSHVDPFTSERS